VRYIKTLAILAVLVLVLPHASAGDLQVLVELLQPEKGQKSAYFSGTLDDPLKVKIIDGPVLDLVDVIVLTFNAEQKCLSDKITKIGKEIEGLDKEKAQENIARLNQEQQTLRARLKTLTDTAGDKKSDIRAVTIYSDPIYDGLIDEVVFTIKKKEAGGKNNPPLNYSSKKIKAIYFLPPQPATPPAKAGKAATSSDGKNGRGDPWLAVSSTLGALQQERGFLVEKLSNLARQRVAVGEMSALEWNNELRAILDRKLENLENVQKSIGDSIAIKDILIQQYQIQLAFLPQPHRQLLAAANGEGTDVSTHPLYFTEGAHFAQLNNFGDGPYMSSSRYAKVAPGMKLTVQSDGYWKLEYRMLTMSGPAQANWELTIRYQDEFGVPREIPLQTFARRIYLSKDTDTTIQNIFHSGNHPAISDHFGSICTTGRLLRKGHIQFLTDNELTGEDVAK